MPSSVERGTVLAPGVHQLWFRIAHSLSRASVFVFLVAVGLVVPACGDTARPFGNNPGAAGSGHGSGGAASGSGGAAGPGGVGGSDRPGGGGGTGAGAGGGSAVGGRAGSIGTTGSGGAGGRSGSGGASGGGGRAGGEGTGGKSGAGGASGLGGMGGRGGSPGLGGASGTSCQELAKQYEAQLPAAKECADLGTQCQMQVPSGLDCGIDCMTVVNDSRVLGALWDAWKAGGCVRPATCAQIRCVALEFGHCDPDSASTTKYRCSDTAR